jgi:hypothetical protein
VAPGDALVIDVVAANLGTAAETFNVSVYYNNTLAETKSVSDLSAGANLKVSFSLDTTSLNGVYIIKAVAKSLPGEVLTVDNVGTSGVVVREAEQPQGAGGVSEVFMYATVVLVIALVLVIAYFFLKIRKPKLEIREFKS